MEDEILGTFDSMDAEIEGISEPDLMEHETSIVDDFEADGGEAESLQYEAELQKVVRSGVADDDTDDKTIRQKLEAKMERNRLRHEVDILTDDEGPEHLF